jgi:hypothetical protein
VSLILLGVLAALGLRLVLIPLIHSILCHIDFPSLGKSCCLDWIAAQRIPLPKSVHESYRQNGAEIVDNP